MAEFPDPGLTAKRLREIPVFRVRFPQVPSGVLDKNMGRPGLLPMLEQTWYNSSSKGTQTYSTDPSWRLREPSRIFADKVHLGPGQAEHLPLPAAVESSVSSI